MYRKNLSKFALIFVVLSLAFLVYAMPVFASGKIITDTITSPSLEGNLLGDSATRDMTIYLPPSYETSDKRYPVVYLLHGYSDTEKQYIGKKDDPKWLIYKQLGLGDPPDFPDNGFDGMMDDLISAGKISEMIIVTPNADNAYGGSYYNNSVLIGKYEDYITYDLVNYIDGKYRTISNRNSRAIAGQSMGGYGAIKLAMRYPDVFGAVASHSGVLYLDLFKAMIPAIIAENPEGMTGPSADKGFTTATYAMSAAFAPNLNKPPFFVDLAFEYPSPEVIKSVWDKFLQNDPVTMVPTHINNLASLNFIYMDAGDIDEYGANFQTQAYHEALNAVGIKHVYRTFSGGHRNKLFESLGISLSYLSDIFEQSNVVSIWQKTRVAGNAHDWDEYGRYLADNVVFDLPPNPPVTGKETVKQFQIESLKGSSDNHTEATLVLPTNNFVIVESLMSGTHDGVWAGNPATGKKYGVMVLDIFYSDGNKINKVTEYMDYLPLGMQLGLIPSSGPLEPSPSFALPNALPNNLSSIDATKELLKRWNDHNLSAYSEMINPDAKILVGAIGSPVNRDAYIAMQEGFFKSFPDIKGDTINQIAIGDGWTLTEQVFSGTQKGAYLGIPATGKSFMVRAGIISKFDEDGLLTNMSVHYDNMTILAQIQPTTQEINIATRKLAYTDLWNKGNLDIVDKIYSNDFAGSMAGYSGKDEVKMSVAATLKAYPDIQFTIDDIFASGDLVVTRITAIGTQKGEFMGVPPTNAKGEITGISIARFDSGLIKEVWENNDELATAEHLGVIPPTRKAYVWGDPSKVTGDPGTPEANKALAARDVEEFWNQKKVNESDKNYSPDFISHNPNTPVCPTSLEVFKKVALVYITAFPDMQITIKDMIASGDKVAVRWATTGTNKGDLMGIPATGRKMNWSGITIYRFADGKIAEEWWAYDMLGMIQQLTAPDDLEANKAVVKRIDDVYNKRDLSIVDEIYAPDTVDMFSGAKGIAGTKDRFAVILSAFPEFNEEILDMVAEGNIVTTRAIIKATHKGTYMGIPPTGKKGTMTSMGAYEVINGKITKSWRYNDELGFLQQGGLFPSGGKTDFSWGMDKTQGTGKEDPAVMKNLITRLYDEVWNQGKMDVIDEIYAPNFQTSLVAGGKEGFKKYVAGFKLGIPDVTFKIDSQFTEGDMVVTQWTVTGTQTGNFMGIPPTGKKATIVGISFNRIENGLIAQSWNSMDMLSAMVQLGVIPAPKTPAGYDNVFFASLTKGLNMISLPLKPVKAFTARSFANEIGATAVIKYDEVQNRFVGFSSNAPDNGFDIEGGQGYIVNVSESRTIAFTGAAWTNEPPVLMAPSVQTDSAWAFIVNGSVLDDKAISDRYTIIVKNLSTGVMTSENVDASGYFSTAWGDLNRKAVVKSGDKIEVALTDSSGQLASGPFVYTISQNEIGNAILNVPMKLGKIMPKATALLQNFPNPFNPETWIPFQLIKASDVTITIFNTGGNLVRTLELGRKDPGVYASQINAAHWDGKNDLGETVSSGIYFYNIKAGDFSATKKMIVKK